MDRKLLINFVPATDNSKNNILNKKHEDSEPNQQKEKPNASKMYQEVLSMPSTSSQHLVNTRIKRSKGQPPLKSTPNFKSDDIFRFCQHGQLKLCRQWLTSGGDVNTRDQFQWTPLMVAVSGGHTKIVELLIKSGANPAISDSKNRDAYSCARKSGHNHLTKVMEKLCKEQNKNDQTNTQTKSETTTNRTSFSFECDVCGPVCNQSRDDHLLSITHQLKNNVFSSEQTRTLGNFAHVNPRFMGYQMLRREGWNGYTGLGAREDGRKYPVKAQPNPGRACIGLPQHKPETASAQIASTPVHKGKFKHRLKREEQKKRQFEAEYRRSFY